LIVDTSAILAVLLNEPDADVYVQALVDSERSAISAANALEVSIVLSHKLGEAALIDFDDLVREVSLEIAPVSADEYFLARGAYLSFGKGRHPAALNFGDCFAYALASSRQESLLFKGADFKKTDVSSVLR